MDYWINGFMESPFVRQPINPPIHPSINPTHQSMLIVRRFLFPGKLTPPN